MVFVKLVYLVSRRTLQPPHTHHHDRYAPGDIAKDAGRVVSSSESLD